MSQIERVALTHASPVHLRNSLQEKPTGTAQIKYNLIIIGIRVKLQQPVTVDTIIINKCK